MTTTQEEKKMRFETAAKFLANFSGRIFIQTFDDNKARGHPKLIHSFVDANLKDCYEELVALNTAGAGIYFSVNEIKQGAQRVAQNVTNVRAHFIDLDGSPIEPVLEFEHKPDLILNTSIGKWHAYWLMREPTLPDANRFREVQKAMAVKWSGDKSVSDLPRVMRLPGFYNMKNAEQPFLIRCYNLHDTEQNALLNQAVFGTDANED